MIYVMILLTIAVAWLVLGALTMAVVAALGRAGNLQDEARSHEALLLPAPLPQAVAVQL